MTSFILTLHGRRFILSERQQVRFLESIVDAVSAGGALVDFTHEDGATTALVSMSTPLLLSRMPEVSVGISDPDAGAGAGSGAADGGAETATDAVRPSSRRLTIAPVLPFRDSP